MKPSCRLGINHAQMQNAIGLVNSQGYAALNLPLETVNELGKPLYQAMDAVRFHPGREHYYNEIAFYWPEDWHDVERGIGSFHDSDTLKQVYCVETARKTLTEKVGPHRCQAILDFALEIRRLIIRNHHGLNNNQLRLSRVMARQMNEQSRTTHAGSEVHEDLGYTDRPFQQLLSVILTTYGIPTESAVYQPKIGELLIFNAYDRRRLLGLGNDRAFIHKGPKTGPKMFFFFEFLGPREEPAAN